MVKFILAAESIIPVTNIQLQEHLLSINTALGNQISF
jgi:hypothetical protein